MLAGDNPGTVLQQRLPFRSTAPFASFRTELQRRSAEPNEPQIPLTAVPSPSGGAAACLHVRGACPALGNFRQEPLQRYVLPERRRPVLADTVNLETSLAKINPDHASRLHVDAPLIHG